MSRRPRPVSSLSISAITAAAAAFAAGFVPSSPAQAGPGSGTYDLVLTAQVRDFPASNPDFCKPTSIGANWVEGLVSPTLGAQGVPTYTGQGKRVTVPANDSQGRAIANSMIQSTVLIDPNDVLLVNAPTYSNNPKVDTYNPNLGPYGGSNIGPAPEIGTSQPMPVVTVPSISPYVVEYLRDGNASSTLSSSFRCSKFLVRNYHVLTIQGDVTIVVDDEMVVENFAKIVLAPGARFTVYALKDCKFQNFAEVNYNTWDHTAFTLYKMGTLDVYFQDNVKVCGTVICPDGRVFMHNQADLYGLVTAESLHMQNSAKLHVAEPLRTSCNIVDDTPAQFGSADPGAVSSAASFETWFQDTPGLNMESQARLLFQQQPGEALTFSSDDFRPIDGQLLGAGTWEPNRNFTIEMDSEFTYTPCSGQFFEFSGDGDAYVYIDGKLVMELAGNNTGMKQYVDFDRLGLDPAQPHTLQFFYAQRSCSPSKFNVRTNVELRTKYTVEYETVAIMD